MLYSLIILGAFILNEGHAFGTKAKPVPPQAPKVGANKPPMKPMEKEYDPDYLPGHLNALEMPTLIQGGRGMHFQMPQSVVDGYLRRRPDSTLSGTFKSLFEGYKNGRRMSELETILGDDVFDTVIEYMTYDWLSQECMWTVNLWGQELNGWHAMDTDQSCVFDHVQSTIWDEVSGWFELWMNRNAEQGRTIYSDALVDWKEEIAARLLMLKRADKLIKERPKFRGMGGGPRGGGMGGGGGGGGARQMKMGRPGMKKPPPQAQPQQQAQEIPDDQSQPQAPPPPPPSQPQGPSLQGESNPDNRVGAGKVGYGYGLSAPNGPQPDGNSDIYSGNAHSSHLKFGRAKRQFIFNPRRRRLPGECSMINPIELFGDKWEEVSAFVARHAAEDFSLSDPIPPSLTAQVSVAVQSCSKTCMTMNTGITWDVLTGEAFLHWSYGTGATASTDASSYLELAFFDTDLEQVFDDFYRVGIETNKLGVDFVFDKQWNINGLAFQSPFKQVSSQELSRFRVNFHWLYTGRIAKKIDNHDYGFKFYEMNEHAHASGSNPLSTTDSWQIFATIVAILMIVSLGVYGWMHRKSVHSLMVGRSELSPLMENAYSRET